jgi:hypothetical protein
MTTSRMNMAETNPSPPAMIATVARERPSNSSGATVDLAPGAQSGEDGQDRKNQPLKAKQDP